MPFTVDSAVFDERNLVSAAGLVPLLELTEKTEPSELIDEHVDLRSGRVNAALAIIFPGICNRTLCCPTFASRCATLDARYRGVPACKMPASYKT